LGTTDDVEAAARFSAFLSKGVTVFTTEARFCGVGACDVLDYYEAEHVDKHVVARERQRIAIRHLKRFFVGVALRNIDVAASRAYARARCDGSSGASLTRKLIKGDATIRRELTTLRAAANFALKHDLIKADELPRLELPRSPAPEETLWLTRQEVDAIYNAAEGPLADFIALAYWTASRRSAVEKLTVKQVDLARKRINLRTPGSVVTKKRKPIVPIHPKIMPIVEKLVAGSKDGWIFGPAADFYMPFRKTCNAVGIDEARAHPHVLRHSRATHLLQDGVNIFTVASLLGDTVQTVQRVYAHACPDHMAAEIGDG
jgi:integrase